MEILIVVAPIVVIGGFLLFKVVKYGGLRAALYGAPVGREIGELRLAGASVPSQVVRVRVLHGSEKHVGIELAAKGPLSYSVTPIALSRTEARTVSDWLARAAGD